MSDLLVKIQEEMKSCMRARNMERLGVIRLMLAAIKQYEVDQRVQADDAQILVILDKAMRQRQEAIEQYQKAGRVDLVNKEEYERAVIRDFLPEPLSEEAVAALIRQAIGTVQASSIKDMSKVMAEIKRQAQGRVDMLKVNLVVKALLS